MTRGWFNSVLVRVAPALLAYCMRLWFATCTLREHNSEVVFSPDDSDKQAVATFWHYSILFVLYRFRKYRVTAMVSASRDGEYIARLAGHFGFQTTRGSRNQKGMQALKGMLRAVGQGGNAAIVADGSQGPPRRAQPGAVLLASRTGVPILPMAWSASAYWTIRSWDRTVVPKPFCIIDLYYGGPLVVPAKISADEVEHYRKELEDQLNELYRKAWACRGKAEH